MPDRQDIPQRRRLLRTQSAGMAVNGALPSTASIPDPAGRGDAIPLPYRITDPSEQPTGLGCCLSLADAFLTPARFVSGLVRLLAHHLNQPADDYGVDLTRGVDPVEWACTAAHVFACAPPTPNNLAAIEIGPLPAEVANMAKAEEEPEAILTGNFTKVRDLLPGAWTVVINVLQAQQGGRHGDFQSFFQCSFVRPRNGVIKAEPSSAKSQPFGPGDLEVRNLEGFLSAAAPDVDFEGVKRELERLERRGAALITEDSLRNRFRFARRPMDAQAAYDFLQQTFDDNLTNATGAGYCGCAPSYLF